MRSCKRQCRSGNRACVRAVVLESRMQEAAVWHLAGLKLLVVHDIHKGAEL